MDNLIGCFFCRNNLQLNLTIAHIIKVMYNNHQIIKGVIHANKSRNIAIYKPKHFT